jgi:hypothetical protein
MLIKVLSQSVVPTPAIPNGLQDRAAIPNANEALPPQGAAAGPMEYNGERAQAKEETAQPHINATNCMSEITPAEDSFKAKKRNAKDVQGVAKKSKGTVAEIYGTSVTVKYVVYGRLIFK